MKRVGGFGKIDEAARKRMAALSEVKTDEIDLSDIPEWTAGDFKKAVPFHSIWKPRKEQITAWLDADILLWLRSHRKGYQTFMNELLQKDMQEAQKRMA